ncbi:AGAP009744-PA-like protein [Anopheles sinensis]|uniref:AGAP009744-PA-like protein n=3 Tax=Anopheles TaxID=44482 RepID=A0A084WU31_ANOSI|nr:AGAP009744-PA-like protein [Anopheles sinensis]
MHSVGIHSALAIKRQRKRRDNQRKARERRYSIQSSESGDTHSPHGSTRRKFHPQKVHITDNNNLDTKVVTSIGMLHIGVVFVVFGIFLLGAGFFPDNVSNQPQQSWHIIGKGTWWNELVCTGLFAVGLGIFLIILNCVISNREEQDLESYVQRQLTRSRSGHRLERDVETGGLTTRHHRKAMQIQKGAAERGLDDLSNSNVLLTPTSSEVVTPTTPSGVLGASGEILLEKILEEDSSYGDPDYYSRNVGQSPPGADNDKRLLLGNGHTGAIHMTDI